MPIRLNEPCAIAFLMCLKKVSTFSYLERTGFAFCSVRAVLLSSISSSIGLIARVTVDEMTIAANSPCSQKLFPSRLEAISLSFSSSADSLQRRSIPWLISSSKTSASAVSLTEKREMKPDDCFDNPIAGVPMRNSLMRRKSNSVNSRNCASTHPMCSDDFAPFDFSDSINYSKSNAKVQLTVLSTVSDRLEAVVLLIALLGLGVCGEGRYLNIIDMYDCVKSSREEPLGVYFSTSSLRKMHSGNHCGNSDIRSIHSVDDHADGRSSILEVIHGHQHPYCGIHWLLSGEDQGGLGHLEAAGIVILGL